MHINKLHICLSYAILVNIFKYSFFYRTLYKFFYKMCIISVGVNRRQKRKNGPKICIKKVMLQKMLISIKALIDKWMQLVTMTTS